MIVLCSIPTDDEATDFKSFITSNKYFISQLIGKNNQTDYEYYFQSERIVALEQNNKITWLPNARREAEILEDNYQHLGNL